MLRRTFLPDREEKPQSGPARNRPTLWRLVAERRKGLDRYLAMRGLLGIFAGAPVPGTRYGRDEGAWLPLAKQ